MSRALAALVLATVVLGACGGDDADPEAAPTPDSTAAPTTAAPLDPADVAADPSRGCGASPAVAPGETQQDVASGELVGRYARVVPPAYDQTTPVPVVFDLHGLIETGPIHAAHTGLGPYGEAEGFVTVTPELGRDPAQWELTGGGDVAFIADLLDRVEGDLCVDRNRVFVTGLSMGGMMTTVLGCELADRFAAAAPVAGVTDAECERSRPVPAVIFFGTEDPVLDYDGGLGAGAAGLPAPGEQGGTLGELDEDDREATVAFLPGAEAAAEQWAAGNGCPDAEPSVEAVAADVDRLDYGCAVQLYRIEGGGHTWPGSDFDVAIEDIVGPVTMSIDANEVMWDFFREHPRGP